MPQKPKKTNGWAEKSTEVFVCDPAERLNPIGRLPMNAAEAGGQSWLVGLAAEIDAESSGTQATPALGPAEQVGPAPLQSGHGTSPSVGPVR